MDTLHAQGVASSGSLQIAELLAHFGLEHDEYEERQRKLDTPAADSRLPLWKRAPH